MPIINGENYTEEQIRRMEQGFDDYKDVRDRAEHMEVTEEDYGFEPTPEPIPEPTPEPIPEPDPKKKIEEEIEKFKLDAEKLKKAINVVKRSLILDVSIDLDVTEAIKGLDAELKELDEEANEIIEDIDKFKAETEESEFSMTPAQIKQTVKGFKQRIKELKQHQIDKYNARVVATNKLLDELRGTEGLENIPENIPQCEVNVTDWRNIKYLDQIDYNKLIEVNKKISEINKSRGQGTGDDGSTEKVNLDEEILWIETKIRILGTDMKDNMSKEEIERLRENLHLICDRTNEFNIKLENNKNNLSKGEYDKYFVMLNDAQANLSDLNIRLNSILNKEKDVNSFEELRQQLNDLDRDVTNAANWIESLYGNILSPAVSWIENMLGTLDKRLEDIKKDIEERQKNGKLDKNQYNQLMKNVDEIEKKLQTCREKVKDPAMVKDADIFALLNGQIDGLESALDKLEDLVEKMEKPTRDKASRTQNKENRKQIDAIIKRLEEEIKLIEKYLEMHKDQDPDKYKATKERLDNVKERLDKIGKKYRKKCPLLVRVVKSAKDFYKKHKKMALIIAGLAAIALIHATVGPVLIPAIMHGNIVVSSSVPALRGFIKFVNNILGTLIGATRSVDGLWTLANGVIINPLVGSTSLLKGLAISGIGTTALVTPVIIAIKKLVEKMKTADLKKKLSEENKKIKEKVSVKNKKETSEKKLSKKTHKEILELTSKYYKSGKSIEEFCEEEGLSETDKKFLESYSELFKENVEKGTSRKGR